MSQQTEMSKKYIENLSKNIYETLNLLSPDNLGIYEAIKIIAKELNLWEMQVILFIAEHEPVTIENIHNAFEKVISRSTIYRRVAEMTDLQLLQKDEKNSIHLAEKLHSLRVLSKIHHQIQQLEGKEK